MNERKRIVVIGGSAAGPKAAARARRFDENACITMIQKVPDLSMASCGYPYFVGGVIEDRTQLICTPTGVVRDPLFFMNAKNISAKTRTEAVRIDRRKRTVVCRDLSTGDEFEEPYDKLIIATGSIPRMPPVPGSDLDGITTLQSMQDADYLRRIRDEGRIKKAVVVGGGLIGMETCEALHLAGIEITVIEMMPQILMFLDPELAKLLENNVKAWAANVITDNAVAEFLGENGRVTGVKLQNGTELPCELAVVAIGVKPNSQLARDAGLEIGRLGGVLVNDRMATSDPDIYAAGDCVEVRNIITGENVLAPYGDLANLQGRVAGENAVSGNVASFPGTVQTGVCKVFNYQAGSTGLSERTASKMGYDIETVVTAGPDRPGFMGGLPLISKMIVEKSGGRLLGFQCVGPGDVSKQVAIAAMALQGGLTIDTMVNLDLPYAPPFSLAIDNFIATAHVLQNKLRGLFQGISAEEVKRKIDNSEKPFIIDMRGPEEYEAMRLGIGERLIPLGALRKRTDELPEDKDTEIITYCKISLRGYEGVRFIQSLGYTNVKVMEGGIAAWPYPREK
ncbi:MAG: FAD-dependent oxidoreductase [Candidatus Thermoplasmatota archaeon]|nr:FAD-dependent oxidoreductase [Candidatus Thermoplasmatota archaeon]